MDTGSKEISRRVFEEVWNDRNVNAVDELMAANYVHHDPQSIIPSGIDGYKQFATHYLNAFPDLRFTIEEEISEGDMVVTRWTATGTHHGDLSGLPRTGKPISVTGMTMARMSNGRVVESWSNWDTLGMLRQLGASLEEMSRAA